MLTAPTETDLTARLRLLWAAPVVDTPADDPAADVDAAMLERLDPSDRFWLDPTYRLPKGWRPNPNYRDRRPKMPAGDRERTDEERALLGWFAAHRDRTPDAPFALRTGVTVTDRNRFLDGIDRDIRAGANSPRVVGLVADLTDLRRLVDVARPSAKGAA